MFYLFRRLARTQLINFAAFVTWIEGFLVHLLAIGSNVQSSSDVLYFRTGTCNIESYLLSGAVILNTESRDCNVRICHACRKACG